MQGSPPIACLLILKLGNKIVISLWIKEVYNLKNI